MPPLDVPEFVWLKITGGENDDFFRESDRTLSVSKEVLDVIKAHGAPDLIATPINAPDS